MLVDFSIAFYTLLFKLKTLSISLSINNMKNNKISRVCGGGDTKK